MLLSVVCFFVESRASRPLDYPDPPLFSDVNVLPYNVRKCCCLGSLPIPAQGIGGLAPISHWRDYFPPFRSGPCVFGSFKRFYSPPLFLMTGSIFASKHLHYDLSFALTSILSRFCVFPHLFSSVVVIAIFHCLPSLFRVTGFCLCFGFVFCGSHVFEKTYPSVCQSSLYLCLSTSVFPSYRCRSDFSTNFSCSPLPSQFCSPPPPLLSTIPPPCPDIGRLLPPI